MDHQLLIVAGVLYQEVIKSYQINSLQKIYETMGVLQQQTARRFPQLLVDPCGHPDKNLSAIPSPTVEIAVETWI